MSFFGFATTADEVIQALPDQVKGRTFLITGTSNRGLGANAAISLARASPAHLILVSRNKSKVDPVIEQITSANPDVAVTFVACELSDFDSVRKAADEILNNTAIPKIDVIINNAGVMAIPEYTKDKQGHELTLSSNHLGHFLLTNLLLPKVLAAAPGSRIVNLSSEGHRIGPFRFDDYNFSDGKTYDSWSAYGQSKTANILFSMELARKLAAKGVASYAVHPGGIMETNLASHLSPEAFGDITAASERNNGTPTLIIDVSKLKNLAQGTAPILVAALEPTLEGKSGSYMEDCQVADTLAYARSSESAEKLWKLSEELVGQKFDV